MAFYAGHKLDDMSCPQLWGQITTKQADDLRAALTASPRKFPLPITVVPGATADAIDFAEQLMNIVGSVPGWAAAVSIIGDAEYSPRQTGLNIAMRVGSDPAEDENASALKAAFQKAGFRPNYILDHLMPAAAVKLVIGKNP